MKKETISYFAFAALAILFLSYGTMAIAIITNLFEAWMAFSQSIIGKAVGYWQRQAAHVAVLLCVISLVLEFFNRKIYNTKSKSYYWSVCGLIIFIILVVSNWY